MPIRLIHLGAGGRGAWPVREVPGHPDYESVALVDTSAENLAAARQVSGLSESQCFGTLAEAMATVEADAVAVITPPDLHAEQCMEAVVAGKHVLVEKPFAKSLDSAVQICSQAAAKDVRVIVCQNRRFCNPAHQMREVVRSGQLGRPEFGQVSTYGWRPRTHHSGRDAHAYLWERGVHDFDAAMYMFDSVPARLWCDSFNPSWSPYRGGGGIYAWIEFANGCRCGFTCTFAAHSKGGDTRIDFEGGTVVPGPEGLVLHAPGADAPQTLTAPSLPSQYDCMLDSLRDYAAGGHPPGISGPANLTTIGIIEAMSLSAETGAVVDFADFMQQHTGAPPTPPS
ncbi:MAG TPA: hypothetical protein DIC52_13165 [Candidatus Latescibacteria bacterium]|nr:hypothetical protein [Candidatus Latescibacterota bacterium]